MEAKEKAKELLEKYINEMPCLANQTGRTIIEHAKKSVLITINEIESALIDCSELSDSLQNMDRELNFWQNVRKEVETF